MCVIVLVDSEEARPSEEMIELMWTRNPDGGGAAWRKKLVGGKKVVAYEKGLMKEEGLARMKELAAKLPIPFILHARIATIGEVKASMTHPFVIDKADKNALKGETEGYVLFHNGTVKEWVADMKQLAFTTGTPLPSGQFSDSRALAWMCSILGPNLMTLYPEQKGFAFGPAGWEIFEGKDGWKQVEDPDSKVKVWCSNARFLLEKKTTNSGNGAYKSKPYCNGLASCSRQDLNDDGKCPIHAGSKTVILALPPANEVSRTDIPFPPTPRDLDDPQGPMLPMEVALKAFKLGRIPKNYLNSVARAYERLNSRNVKDAERAKKQLIVAHQANFFLGLLV